ncbi:LysR family transcriptional regulator [Pseudoalteromonas sp. NZS127_1]|uniref:LysR family transcriptional regulator n=1 Tax=unclassified Pseudoalteromonas TaxID=194690 RepID=UPI0013FD97A7|nr:MULTISPECIES: LysR family transcriptional regulator [unclassified Pseudoalteromonas]MBG9995607.1 LysR family transcriptional regulator [Pseudoalteromonas sp. NZS127_1]MBH0011499.1 LysR family transcriptional regulator [Pseudoalteromonas sp. NZS100_1]MBH0028455.1 LysR family transcriptional regulator [Pseudoalteromonas sp. SWN29]MBH0049603.1 LysR family transcriptional regulator [Pseudoalteromonas sp. SWYJZ19]MBH0075066.1 LysR family transcriptional regulator [Pseudoalteromonas sp. SWYJ118]
MSKLDRLDIKQLRIFQALIREKNASKAASKLGLTQQAVSEQLKKLRDVFDDQLFLRKTTGFVPTPYAEELSVDIDKLLNDFQALLAPKIFDPKTVNDEFVIAATDYAQQVVLPALVKVLRAQAPNLKLIIRDFEIDSLHDLMESGKVNLAIAFPDYIPSTYPIIKLFEEQHICVTSPNSSIAGTKPSLAEIASYPSIIASPSRPNFKGSIDDWFKSFDLTRNVVVSAPCFSIVPMYLETTDSIAFLPSRAVSSELVKIELLQLPAPFDVIAAWHPRYNKNPLHKWVVSKLVVE